VEDQKCHREYGSLHAKDGSEMTVRKQGAWGLWWLVGLTLGIYYYVWYKRINDELLSITGEPRSLSSEWYSQLIPFYNIYALWLTAERVNKAHVALGSPTRVAPMTAAIWAPIWFSSHTRYLQRRINILHDIQASASTRPAAAPTG
jgi:hypothetical protein